MVLFLVSMVPDYKLRISIVVDRVSKNRDTLI